MEPPKPNPMICYYGINCDCLLPDVGRYVEKTEIAVETQPGAKQQDAASGSDCSGNKKKRDRFNGMTEEDVLKRTVPDLLAPNLDIIIVSRCSLLTRWPCQNSVLLCQEILLSCWKLNFIYVISGSQKSSQKSFNRNRKKNSADTAAMEFINIRN